MINTDYYPLLREYKEKKAVKHHNKIVARQNLIYVTLIALALTYVMG